MSAVSQTLPPELAAELEQARRKRFNALGPPEALDWLAVVPEWTESLAVRCGFPVADAPISLFIERAVAGGVCETRRVDAETAFWMPAYARTQYVEAFGSGRTGLSQTASRVASVISKEARDDPAAAGLMKWCELAAAGPLYGPQRLTERVAALTAVGDIGAALDWLAAAEPLAGTSRGAFEEALARGRRRVGLVYRARYDAQALANNIERPEAIAALWELITGPNDLWATHFIGMGGVGKTMLVRYLGAGLGSAFGTEPLLVGRVDFDHLDARFPWERPAELLIALADSLVIHVAESAQEAAIERLIEAVRQADEGRPAGQAVTALDPAMSSVYAGFNDVLNALPGRPVLVLDTCEELAKLHAPGEPLTSIDRTFEILEQVHSRCPRARVVLAGRRLLATRGAGWKYNPQTVRPGALASLTPRPYLRLFEMRGFGRKEAQRLLSERHGVLNRELTDAILAASPESGRVPGLPHEHDAAEPRFNPFDLELLARWYDESPDLAPADLVRVGSDGYVKARIIDRLTEPGLVDVLPAVALLGRFDQAMLAPVLNGDPAATMTALLGQEWISSGEGEGPTTWVLQVEPRLLGRLRRWYEESDPQLINAARERLGPGLRDLLLGGGFKRLGVERIEAAMRCLDAPAAFEVWQELDRLFAETGEWGIARSACERVLDDEEPLDVLSDALVRAAVTAVLAAVRLHQPDGGQAAAAAAWREVEAILATHSTPISQRLYHRAMVMAAVSDPLREPEPSEPWWEVALPRLLQLREEQAIATALAGIEAVLERGTVRPPAPADLLRYARESRLSPWLRAAVLCAQARWWAWEDRQYDADRTFKQAIEAAPAQQSPQQWSDWIAPGALADRVRLEWMVHEADNGRSSWGAEVYSDAMGRLQFIDAQLVLSLSIESSLVTGQPAVWELGTLTRAAERGPATGTSSRVHRRIAPLFVAVAKMLVARGKPERALDLLERRGGAAAGSRGASAGDAASAEEANVATLEIVRALRLGDRYGSRALREAQYVTGRSYASAVAAIALTQPPEAYPQRPQRPEDWTAWERARPLSHAAPPPPFPSGPRDPELADEPWSARTEEETRRGRSTAPPLDPTWLRLSVRERPRPHINAPAGSLARALTEEGELVAQRRPADAVPLLRDAVDLYALVGDWFGTFRASTAAALAQMRDGRSNEAKQTLNELVGPAYEVVRENVRGLPSWYALAAVSINDVEPVWQGWVSRLQLALAWAAGLIDAGGAAVETQLPAVTAPQEKLAPARSKSSKPPDWLVAIIGTVAIAIVIGLALGDPAGLIAFAGLLTSVVVVGLFGGYFSFVWHLRGSRLEIGPSASGAEYWTVSLVLKMRRRLFSPYTAPMGAELTMHDGEPLQRSNRVTKQLAGLRRISGRGRVPLDVAHSLQPVAWESALTLVETSENPKRLLDFYRAVHLPTTAATRHLVAGGEPDSRAPARIERTVVIGGSERWAGLGESAWRGTLITTRLGGVAVARAQGDAAIVHLIGAPALTSSGWHLRLGDEPSTAQRGGIAAAADESQTLLAPEELRVELLELAVVQGTPGARNRDFSDGLRAFAAGMTAAGAGAVVVIPGVTPTAASAAAGALARSLGREPIDRHRILRAARMARVALAEALVEDPSSNPLQGPVYGMDHKDLEHQPAFKKMRVRSVVEIALDLCVFISEA